MTKQEAADELVLAVETYLKTYYSQASYETKNITDWAQDVMTAEALMNDAVRAYKEAS